MSAGNIAIHLAVWGRDDLPCGGQFEGAARAYDPAAVNCDGCTATPEYGTSVKMKAEHRGPWKTPPAGAVIHYVRFSASDWCCDTEGPGYCTTELMEVTCPLCACSEPFRVQVAAVDFMTQGFVQARWSGSWRALPARPVHKAASAIGLLEEALFLSRHNPTREEQERWEQRAESFLRALIA